MRNLPTAGARAGELGREGVEHGLVVLRWMKILRATFKGANAAMVPSGPSMLMWPMRWPVFWLMPSCTISSSRHNVPSKNTSSASCRRARKASVIAAQPGM